MATKPKTATTRKTPVKKPVNSVKQPVKNVEPVEYVAPELNMIIEIPKQNIWESEVEVEFTRNYFPLDGGEKILEGSKRKMNYLEARIIVASQAGIVKKEVEFDV